MSPHLNKTKNREIKPSKAGKGEKNASVQPPIMVSRAVLSGANESQAGSTVSRGVVKWGCGLGKKELAGPTGGLRARRSHKRLSGTMGNERNTLLYTPRDAVERGGHSDMRAQGNLTCLVLLPVPCVPVAHKRAGVVLIQVQLRQHSLPVGGAQEGTQLSLTTKGREVKVPTRALGLSLSSL